MVSGDPRWTPVVFDGLRCSPVVFGGLRWSPVVFDGLRGVCFLWVTKNDEVQNNRRGAPEP